MEQQTQPSQTDIETAKPSHKEKVLFGTIGALLFSLSGIIVFFLLQHMNCFVSLSGLVAITVSFIGYCLFSGNKASKKGLIISTFASLLSMLVAYFFSFCHHLIQEINNTHWGFPAELSNESSSCNVEWKSTFDIKGLLVSFLFVLVGVAIIFFILRGRKKHD